MNLRTAAFLLSSVLWFSGCSDNSDNSADASQPPQSLTILVTNDDGIGAPGIDSLVNALLQLDNVEVKVVAPAENQSGSSDKTTEGDVVWVDASTTSGHPGIAVYGYPADSVNVALGELGITPDLVVSGVNQGQNVGPLAELSGTIGAARTAARTGIPAVAASAGLGANADYDAAAILVISWIEQHRDALANQTESADTVTSFNVPGCTAGEIRELVQVPLADAIPSGANVFATDCSLEPDSAPTSDVDAMIKGFAAVTQVPLDDPAAPVDYRSAMVSRLTEEWGDSELAEQVVESVGADGLDAWEERVPMDDVATTPLLSYHPDPTPAAEINTLAVFTFGYRGDVEAESEPGPVNEQMAAEVIEFLAHYPVPVYAQTNVAKLLQDAGVPQVTSIDRVVGPDGKITYLSTMGAAQAILAKSAESGKALGIVGVVCFADHEGRCVLTAEAAGMEATAVEGIDLPTTYDTESAQPWTRDRVSYLATDLLGRRILP